MMSTVLPSVLNPKTCCFSFYSSSRHTTLHSLRCFSAVFTCMTAKQNEAKAHARLAAVSGFTCLWIENVYTISLRHEPSSYCVQYNAEGATTGDRRRRIDRYSLSHAILRTVFRSVANVTVAAHRCGPLSAWSKGKQ